MAVISLLLISLAAHACTSVAAHRLRGTPELSFDLEWVRQSFTDPPGLSTCSGAKGPCVGLVGIQSRADFFERRELIRQTWLRYVTPGIDFVFVLGLPEPGVAQQNVHADLLRHEYETHKDIVILNTTEVDSYESGIKSYATLAWGASLGTGRYLYYAKVDDDNVVNPLQLRLLMTSLPRERVFYGKQIEMFGRTKFSLAPRKNVGPLYFVSADIAHALARQSFQGWMDRIVEAKRTQYPEEANVPYTEDMAMSMIVQLLVPHQEWHAARQCEVYNHRRDKFITYRHSYNNQTVACHHVKDLLIYAEAMGELQVFMKAMQQDCREWTPDSADYATRAYVASPTPECSRWLDRGACPGAPRASPSASL